MARVVPTTPSRLRQRVARRGVGIRVAHAVRMVQEQRLTYLSEAALRDLAWAVRRADHKSVPGVIVECGTALGGSAVVLGVARRSGKRRLKLYDVFGMIPPPGDRDGADVHARYEVISRGDAVGIEGSDYYGYRNELLRDVRQTLRRFEQDPEATGIDLVPGLFEDTLSDLSEQVSLAHLDGDWYDSTWTCLEHIVPLLPVEGRLVVDDYGAWSGCTEAVNDFFSGRSGFRYESRARLHIVRSPG